LQKKSRATPGTTSVAPAARQVQKPRGEGHETWRLFFVSVLAVPPPRFRPAAVIGGVTAENPQNVQLTKVMSIASKIRGMQGGGAGVFKEGEDKLAALFSSWIDLQIHVNGFMDASKAAGGSGGSTAQSDVPVYGIRQLLEKKQGLFRMNMMGKRVNHACRSVISPDLNVRAGEIGLPLRFAKVCFKICVLKICMLI
jgi:DNA-directed RNA polymerase I subunit RPA1